MKMFNSIDHLHEKDNLANNNGNEFLAMLKWHLALKACMPSITVIYKTSAYQGIFWHIQQKSEVGSEGFPILKFWVLLQIPQQS